MCGVSRRENLVLIGFMGCGKSTIGRQLQHMLGWSLVDMDISIEQDAGRDIPAIFEAEGEAGFRRRETELLKSLVEEPDAQRIISTGGGVVVAEGNRALLRRLGYVVWLRAPADVVLARTSRNNDRPLLRTENPLERIRTLLDQRTPIYREVADLEIDTSDLSVDEICTGILESARYHFGGQG